ncbi:discoidin domain-containing protein [Subtercola sp. RTI3]|uniref:discoidin domain-containing protein n=1 Tax=Subtercola sp. RTI3 TaxID=3048639 RepID=UPI002B226EE0|nr:discoidin domain-containing protein [Subtercola sp. RTI3]MEA9987115.1 discoidin domain-containing protein [Subtercola sp. RTI3]
MKKRSVIAIVAAIALSGATLVVATPAQATAIGASDFLKASGSVLKKSSGTGSTVNLRGTNLGGWLTQEDWMSPLGEFAVDRTGWTATASSGTASNAIDGSGTTRWTTGVPQSGSEWLQVDLGAPTLFNRLSIDDRNFAGDYPRSYSIAVSADGSTWTSVAAAPGADSVTTATFTAQVARYVKISQTGSSASWWSVGELNLFSDTVLNNSTITASSSAPGTTPGAAIDGNLATTWSTGAAQTTGQSFTLDLGHNVDVGKMLLDSGASAPNDYPRTWDVYGSTDNTNWTQEATGYGSNRIVTPDFQGSKTVRYLRVTQSGTAAQWWTIADLAVYAGSSIDRTGWNVTSSTGGPTTALTDSDVTTRWTTGTAQTPGQWIQVDFGAKLTYNNVTLDTEKNSTSAQDYPRGYTVQSSNDGTSWTTIATGTGTVKATTIGFTATSSRYLRINQTASSGNYWSVGDLSVSLNNDDFSLQESLNSRFGSSGAQSIIDAHQNSWITSADLDNIAAQGLNFIRVPIGWNTFLNLDGTWKANPWTKIDWIVSQAASRGLYVSLDLHTLPGGDCPWGSCGRVGPNPNGFWGNTTYQSWVEGIWKAMATRYKGNAAVAGYDLMNEPLVDYNENTNDVNQKSSYYNTLYNDVRAIDPDHAIFIEAFFDWTKIAAPTTYGWSNVIYELHPYDMGNAKDWTAQNQLVTNQLADAANKQSTVGVPILYGEYSLYYYDDVWARWMAGLNNLNVSWSNWDYKVRGTDADGFGYWGMYYNDPAPVPIINSDDSATFTQKLQKFTTSSFTKNTELDGVISKYAGGLGTFNPAVISTTGWTATASSTGPGGTTSGGIDGNSSTRWNSGQAQAGNEWYKIDMGSTHTIAEVNIQTPTNALWDYPRGLKLETSTDGTTWTTVTTTIGYAWKRTIEFTPTTARYIRLTQTGTAPQWWTIDEVSVYSSY